MKRLVLLILFLSLGLIIMPHGKSHAAPINTKRYIDPTIKLMTEHLVQFQLQDMDNLEVFKEYLRLTDCDLYKSIHSNQFQQRELKQVLQKAIADSKNRINSLYVRVPFVLQVMRYDFDTQSIDIQPASQFKNINTIEIINVLRNICNEGGVANSTITTMPTSHAVRLHFPISLYRIPLHKDLAQAIFEKLDAAARGYETRNVYGYFYIHIEPIEPEVSSDHLGSKALFRGQVDVIDLFSDQEREKLLKRLDLISAY